MMPAIDWSLEKQPDGDNEAVRGREQLEVIVRSTPWLLGALRAARAVGPPQWLIGSGAIRTAVWDRLHGYSQPTPVADVDLIFFDPDDLSPERDADVQAALVRKHPGVPWDATNQAAVHLWFPRKFGYEVTPFSSATEAVATWPETATCVALRLKADETLEIVAPYGLDDLLGLVHRRNPARVTVEQYERRLHAKRIADRWPRVRIEAAR